MGCGWKPQPYPAAKAESSGDGDGTTKVHTLTLLARGNIYAVRDAEGKPWR
jgi:hypothetical protein